MAIRKSRLGKTPIGKQLNELFAIAKESNRLDAERKTNDPTESIEELLSRRQALKLAGVGAATALSGGALASAAKYFDHDGAVNKDVRVAIIGGGIAGLNACYHLGRHGVKAQIYEAQQRTGGRIMTRYNVVGDGLVTEVGASFIDSVHTEMLRLAKTFDIGMWDTMAKSEAKLQPAYFFGGKMRWNKEVIAAMKPFCARIADEAKNAHVLNHQHFNLRGKQLDQLSTKEYIQKIGMEGWLFDFMNVAYMTEDGTEIDTLSAVQFVGDIGTNTSGAFDLFTGSDQRYHTKGGNSLIPEALARRVKSQINLGMWLEKISMDSAGAYKLTFKTDGGTKVVTADYVIMTMPFKILREIEVDIEMPPLKTQAIKELNYGDNCKLILGFSSRFWRKLGTNGLFFTDLPIQSGWDSGWMQKPEHSSLTIFFGGKSAIEQASIPIDERIQKALPELEKMYPGATQEFNGKRTQFNWPHYPFAKASYSSYGVGQQTTFGGVEQQTVGRMYFAGEHCDDQDQGFMNGGAQTGLDAAKALLKAIR